MTPRTSINHLRNLKTLLIHPWYSLELPPQGKNLIQELCILMKDHFTVLKDHWNPPRNN